MKAMYQALAALPHVRFSANSQSTATEYEKWLGLEAGHVKAIWNATRSPDRVGSAQVAETWAQIQSVSPNCTKTVLGIFRYDQNKRPGTWIDRAKRYIERHSGTRA